VSDTRPTQGFHPRALLRAAEPFLGAPPQLEDLRELLLAEFPAITAAFYATIVSHAEAAHFIRDEAKLKRLHVSLQEWMEGFLGSPPEASERAEIAVRMANTHLRIGMPLELTMLGHKNLRQILVRTLMERWPAGDRNGLIDAIERLQRAFDYDSLLMMSCFHGEAIGRADAAATGLRRTKERLEQSLAGQEQLLRATSHELRTPLAGLVGMLRMLKRGVYKDPDERELALDDALGAAHHLQALTEDLLHLARLDLGSNRFKLEDFELREASAMVLRRLASRAEENEVQLVLEDGEPAQVFADKERHAQILTNLVQNAIRHAPEGVVRVRVECFADAGHVCTEVVDDGEGIDSEMIARLFQPFTQSSGGGSLGLGLTICRRLSLAMGGRIVAESEGLGRGSRFAFTLPAAGRHEGADFELSATSPQARILLVDDDAVWSHDLAQELTERLPVAVQAVTTAEAARKAVAETAFQLILVDVALPSRGENRAEDGISLLESLAREPNALLARKWLVSGHDPEFLQAELQRSWHDAFYNKSAVLADRFAFLETVRGALQLRSSEQQP